MTILSWMVKWTADAGPLVSTRILPQYDGVGDGSASEDVGMEDVDGDAAASGDEGVADWHEEVSLSSPAIGDDEDGVYYHATLEFNSEEEEEEDRLR